MKKSSCLFLLVLLALVSCSKDDPKPYPPMTEEWDNLLITALPNPDGLSGSYYMQLIGSLIPSSYTNKIGIPLPFMALPSLHGNDVFVLPGWDSQQEVVKYSLVKGAGLQKTGTLAVPPKSGATNVVVQNDEKAFLSLAFLGKIYVFNPTTMQKLGEIDLSEYGLDDKNPDPACMLIRDNKLFVCLNQLIGGYVPKYKWVDVLIIDTSTLKVDKLIREKDSGLSTPSRPIDQRSIFMDEKGDIYLVCYGGFGLEGHKSGILRIKKGETEFDTHFTWNISDAKIEGETHHADWLHWVQYAGNGKMYALANIPAYHSNPRDYVKDRTAIPVELDLSRKSIRTLKLPRSTPWGSVSISKGTIVYGLLTEKDTGLYLYHPQKEEGSSEAVVKTTGAPQMFRHFGEKY